MMTFGELIKTIHKVYGGAINQIEFAEEFCYAANKEVFGNAYEPNSDSAVTEIVKKWLLTKKPLKSYKKNFKGKTIDEDAVIRFLAERIHTPKNLQEAFAALPDCGVIDCATNDAADFFFSIVCQFKDILGIKYAPPQFGLKPQSSGAAPQYQQLTLIEVPPEPDADEMLMPYIVSCLEAYGDAEGVLNFTREALKQFGRYDKHFDRQRKDFWIAESVRRNVRDNFGDDENDRFEALKADIYNSIVDIYEKKWSDGYERLCEVVKAAGMTGSLGRIWSDERFDGHISETKKGVCHMLVNDDIIKSWVDIDG